MTVISIGQRPSGKNSEHQPSASVTRLVIGLQETPHETCRLPVRPEHTTCPHCGQPITRQPNISKK